MRYKILDENNNVINTIVADEEFVRQNYPGKWELFEFTQEEMAYSLLEKRNSMVISPFQAKAALLQANLLSDVETAINNPETDPLIKLAWETASEFKRTSNAVILMGTMMGWTEEQLDSLFESAATITI